MIKNVYNISIGLIFILYLILSINSCIEKRTAGEEEIRRLVRTIRQQYVPDSSTGIFEINVTKNSEGWLIEGVTDHPEVLDRLFDSLERKSISYRDQVKLLPDEELNGMIYGLVNVSVANLRTSPDHSAELCTQALLGTPLRVLKKQGGWFTVQTPDRYIGWLDEGVLITMDEIIYTQYQLERKIIVTELWGHAYQEPNSNSIPVSDLVMGCVLQYLSNQGNYYKVKYPDERIGYVSTTEAEPFEEWIGDRYPTADNLVSTAKKLMGVPYLWGGTSSKGVDCSGFTKTIYFMNGILLPRDASQQEEIGMLVDDQKFFTRLLPGDLLFFGSLPTDSTSERVVHVGMWIGDMKYIHASDDVHLSSMDFNAADFDEYNYNRYLRSRRILNSQYIDQLFIRKYY